jgi:hypothetical protein
MTTRLGLDLLSPGQADAHVLYNRSLWILEALAIGVVESRSLTDPPTVVDGTLYIPAAGATGAWAGWDNQLMLGLNNAWISLSPLPGMSFWLLAESLAVRWDGSAWV